MVPRPSPASACSLRSSGPHPGRRRRRPDRCSAAPTWSTTSRSCSRRCSCVRGYVVVLLSTTTSPRATTGRASTTSLLLSSLLGMMVMASARDLIHLRGARAAVDPRLHAGRVAQARPEGQRGRPQVLPDGRVRLGRDALRHVAAVRRQPAPRCSPTSPPALAARGQPPPSSRSASIFVVVGFAFKVSAVPFHTWAPDTYEGAPTPGHGVPLGGLEGRRLRGPAAARVRRRSSAATTSTSRCSGCWRRSR